jgi:pyruvate dehydrogenase E2 component (dihydrolipoamide acetyltransferase)
LAIADKAPFASPRAKGYARNIGISIANVEGSGPNGRIIEQDVIYYYEKLQSKQQENTPLATQRRTITPLAKNIANIEKVNIHDIQGSGVNGRILSTDVLKSIHQSVDKTTSKKVKLSGIRKVIAARMSESKRTAPHVTLTVKTEASKLVKFKESLTQSSNLKISYTDILVKIVAESIRKNQGINVSLEKEEIIYHDDINIGVAVALEDGLVVPVIKTADQKSISEIALEVKAIANRAREARLKQDDLANGRFTISNLGMYEVDGFTPVINQPESAILGVGRIIEDVIVENEQIRIGKTMTLSLSFDHRVMDGAPAARFLGTIKYLIEHPDEIISNE